MRTEHFRYFSTVAQEGSFSQAARKLYLSEPALNKNITAFEAELGFKLFIRSRRQLTLTPLGEIFLPLAEKIIKDIDESLAYVRELADKDNSRLRVNHVALNSDPLFDKVIATLKQRQIIENVVVHEGDPKDYCNRLLKARSVDVDITIVKDPPQLPSALGYKVIQELEETVVVPSSHPYAKKNRFSLADLNGMKLVFSSAFPNEAHQQLMEDIDNKFATSINYIIVNSIDSALKLVAADGYFMIKTSIYKTPQNFTAIPLTIDYSLYLTVLWNKANEARCLREFLRALDDMHENAASRSPN